MTERWVSVELTEPDERQEPDWSKVPAARREMVHAHWLKRSRVTRRWRMWEPQLPFFRRFYGEENVRLLDPDR